MKVGLLLFATGHYRQYVAGFLESAREHFFAAGSRQFFLFTDFAISAQDITRFEISHESWPEITLKRYHHICRHAKVLQSMDYLFCSDVDMRFVASCDQSILPRSGHGLTGVLHPGYYGSNIDRWSRISMALQFMGKPGGLGRHRELPFERDARSSACIGSRHNPPYYAGGFNGGRTKPYLAMAESIKRGIDLDQARGYTAVWHDESHLNRYFKDHRPHTISPAYCYPETGCHPQLEGLSPVLLALDKDHAAMRANAPS